MCKNIIFLDYFEQLWENSDFSSKKKKTKKKCNSLTSNSYHNHFHILHKLQLQLPRMIGCEVVSMHYTKHAKNHVHKWVHEKKYIQKTSKI